MATIIDDNLDINKSIKIENRKESINEIFVINEPVKIQQEETREDIRIVNNREKISNVIVFTIISLLILVIIIEIAYLPTRIRKNGYKVLPKYCVYGDGRFDVQNITGDLKEVHTVLRRIGYLKTTNESDWSFLWAHDYPFDVMPQLRNLKHNQKVNYFPGSEYILNKVRLARTDSKYIPKAFELPKDVDDYLKYVAANKNVLFLNKSNLHSLKNVSDIDVSKKKLVQEYVPKPFLVEGHKFDIGVYVVVTSVNPLRVYWYKEDVLLRFCKEKYHPFDPLVLDKYVVEKDYLAAWKVPFLENVMTELECGMKDALDLYLRSQGKDPDLLWKNIQRAISEIFYIKEKYLDGMLKYFRSKENFFQMMRFDLMVDEDLQAHLLGANVSPNHYTAKYNKQLYQQLLYNLFSLVGVSSSVHTNANASELLKMESMVSSQKNLAVWLDECAKNCIDVCNVSKLCALCGPCRSYKVTRELLLAHTEHLNRGDFRRLIPPAMEPGLAKEEEMKNLTPVNTLHHLWYQGKCNMDVTWCT